MKNTTYKTIEDVPARDLLELLAKFSRQNPGLESANYGDDAQGHKCLMAEYRRIMRDGKDFRTLYAVAVAMNPATAEVLEAARASFAGRLQFLMVNGKPSIDYTTGQYFPTEYRAAACSILARIIWCRTRDQFPDGNSLRKEMRKLYGRGLVSRWFN